MGKGTVKKTRKSLTITPKIPQEKKLVNIETLKTGEFFVYDGKLYQLYEQDPSAQCINDGKDKSFPSETMVRAVDVVIKWTYRK